MTVQRRSETRRCPRRPRGRGALRSACRSVGDRARRLRRRRLRSPSSLRPTAGGRAASGRGSSCSPSTIACARVRREADGRRRDRPRGRAWRRASSPGRAEPSGDIEAAAREARYRLLIEAAREAGASHLLLAHNLDDQAETFLMRLVRGAGVFGLAAMRREIDLDGLILVRPFLDVPRTRLAATTAAAGLAARRRSDERRPALPPGPRAAAASRARQRQGSTPRRSPTPPPASPAPPTRIDAAVDRLIAAAVTCRCPRRRPLRTDVFVAAAGRGAVRLLVRLLLAIGGEDYPPRYERLAGAPRGNSRIRPLRCKRTLGGVVVEWRPGRSSSTARRSRGPAVARRSGRLFWYLGPSVPDRDRGRRAGWPDARPAWRGRPAALAPGGRCPPGARRASGALAGESNSRRPVARCWADGHAPAGPVSVR